MLPENFDLPRVSEVLRDLLALELERWGPLEFEPAASCPPSLGADICFAHPSFDLWLSVEPSLASLALTRLLGRTTDFGTPGALTPELGGAWQAICAEVLNRLASGAPVSSARGKPLGAGQSASFWARVEGHSFNLRAFAQARELPPRGRRPVLASTIPVTLPLVFSCAVVPREDWAQLSLGDVFLPQSWSASPTGDGTVFACAPELERCLKFELSDAGLSYIGPASLSFDKEITMAEIENDTAEDAVTDAPLVVRVEVGAVTMSVREWTELAAGDVVSTGNALGSPALLRVAGQQVATGELVNIEGELGVRITKLS